MKKNTSQFYEGQIKSKDGTVIAYDRQGDGPALILVGGGLTDRSENVPLASELGEHFTVYNYDRRGRGKSTDSETYALEHEIEDIAALIKEAGGSANFYGVSTGGALVLEAAATGISGIDKIGVYEVPYNTDNDWPQKWQEYFEGVNAALAKGNTAEALELFMQVTGASQEEINGLKGSPYWAPMEKFAHTLPYDAVCLGNGQPPTSRLAHIKQPTLVATGTDARLPGAAAWVLALDAAADMIAKSIPNAERKIFEGQSHVADPKAVAPMLEKFFKN